MRSLKNGWLDSCHDFRYFNYCGYMLLLEWPSARDEATLLKITYLSEKIEQLNIKGVIELVPAYHSLAIYFDPTKTTHLGLINIIESIAISSLPKTFGDEIHTIPVSYDASVALDLSYVADQLRLTEKEVISIHCQTTYVIHFIGFLPGFLYLGGLDDRLILPRRKSPRIRVPSGSVALAAGQTGIYPVDSPGGWHIIGRTEKNFFQPNKHPPCPYKAGTKVKFESV